MFRSLFTFLFLFIAVFISAQTEIHLIQVGEKAHLSIDLYDEAKATQSVVIGEGGYNLFYKYNWGDKYGDNKDSIKALEKIIAKIVKGWKVEDLRVICVSEDKGDDFERWLSDMKTRKPFKGKPNYHVEYYNTNDYKSVAKKINKLFEKLTLIGPDGHLISRSAYIGNFSIGNPPKDPVKMKLMRAKLLSEKDGNKNPLRNTVVWLSNETDADTVTKTRTDNYGDFEINLPDDEKSTYQLRVSADPKSYKNVIFVNQNGVEISKFDNSNEKFQFLSLKADIVKMTDMPVNEDLKLAYNLFHASDKNSLKIVRIINYGFNKFDLDAPAQETVDQIVTILKDNPKVKVEVISHTDSQGEDLANLHLSEKRSHTVADYIVSKGIDKKRVKAIGKGEKEIRNRCTNGVDCSDKEHEFNRRTEFNFIKPGK